MNRGGSMGYGLGYPAPQLHPPAPNGGSPPAEEAILTEDDSELLTEADVPILKEESP